MTDAASKKKIAVWQAFAVAVRTIPNNLGSAFVVLGILSAVSAVPILIGPKVFPALADRLYRSLWSLLWTPWNALVLAGQVLFSLDIARTGRSTVSRWWDGRRYWSHAFGISIAFALSAAALSIYEPESVLSPIGALLFLLMGLLMASVPRVAFVFHVAINEDLGTLRAFRRSWEMSHGHWWRIVRFCFAAVALSIPLHMVAPGQTVVIGILYNLFAVPIVHVAISLLYLRVLGHWEVAEPQSERRDTDAEQLGHSA